MWGRENLTLPYSVPNIQFPFPQWYIGGLHRNAVLEDKYDSMMIMSISIIALFEKAVFL